MTKDPDVLEIMEMTDHLEQGHETGLEEGDDPFVVHRDRHENFDCSMPHHHVFGFDDPRAVPWERS